MIALRDRLVEIQWSGTELSVAQIVDFFLKNNYQSGERSYRLALRRLDNDTLQALVDGKDPAEVRDSSEAIVAAYERFRSLLRDSGVDPVDVYHGVYRLLVVDVRLERPADNPQVIFESLNSTGVDLAQSDLIRNYLLMGLNSDQQTALYDDYWSKLEDVFRNAGGGFEEFLRDYMALSERSTTQTRADRVYAKFRESWPAGGFLEAAELLTDILKMGRYYAWFLRPSLCPDASLVPALSIARYGGFGTTHAALVARLYDLRERGLVKDGEFAEAMTLLKSYLLRRAVLGLQTGSHWNLFQRIAHAVEEDAALETFKVALVREKGTYAFASDESFFLGSRSATFTTCALVIIFSTPWRTMARLSEAPPVIIPLNTSCPRALAMWRSGKRCWAKAGRRFIKLGSTGWATLLWSVTTRIAPCPTGRSMRRIVIRWGSSTLPYD